MLPLLAAIPSIFQGIQGISQMINGKRKLDGLERPQYEIPTAARQSLALNSAAYADPRMPGESNAYNRIGSAQSAYLRAARDSGAGSLAGLAMSQANTNAAYNNLADTSARYQQQDRQNLMSNLGNYASYQDQQWQMNKFAPYSEKYNEGREQIGAGQQNTFGALNGLASVGMQFLAGRTPRPVDGATISDAGNQANISKSQDTFMNAAARLARNGAMDNYNTGLENGMTPASMFNAYRNYKRGQ